MNKVSYPVMEAFATVQGEGAHSGTPSWFLRLGGCAKTWMMLTQKLN